MIKKHETNLEERNYVSPVKQRWEPGHCCLGKGKLHLVEVHSEEEDQDEPEDNFEEDDTQENQPQQIKLEDATVREIPHIPLYLEFLEIDLSS